MDSEDNINFLDVACLFKIAAETTLERFGSTINASVFDAANLTGTLKQKGLIDFTAYYPGPNSIILTEAGTKLKVDMDAKAADPLDTLDDEILRQMSGGKRYPLELQNTLNIRSRDLAFRIHKLCKQNLLSFELKNGNVELMLTEQGFLKAKTPSQPAQAPQPQPGQAQPQAQQQAQAGQAQPQAAGAAAGTPGSPEQAAAQVPDQPKAPKNKKVLRIAIAAVLLLILIALYYAVFYAHLINV